MWKGELQTDFIGWQRVMDEDGDVILHVFEPADLDMGSVTDRAEFIVEAMNRLKVMRESLLAGDAGHYMDLAEELAIFLEGVG